MITLSILIVLALICALVGVLMGLFSLIGCWLPCSWACW